jgi:hypothetical protein
LRLTRNAGEIDLSGQISGGSHLANYTVTGYSSATFPLDGEFNFNRVGIFLGDGVNAASARLDDSTIETNVPEPASAVFAAIALGAIITGWRLARR